MEMKLRDLNQLNVKCVKLLGDDYCIDDGDPIKIGSGGFHPAWSIRDAMEVLDLPIVDHVSMGHSIGSPYCVELRLVGESEYHSADAESWPLAICKALVSAIEASA